MVAERPDGGDSAGDPPVGSESRPDEERSGRAAFVEALRVKRHAAVGLAVGVGFTALVFVLFVVLPGTYRSPLWYVGLGFVLAMSVAGLVAFLLTLRRAVRLSREL